MAALASIGVGSVAVVAMLLVKGINSDAPIYWGLALSMVFYFGLSLGTRHKGIAGSVEIAS